MEPQYLGDGVYAAVNSFGQVVLTTGTHEEAKANNVIYLELGAIHGLIEFVKRAGLSPS